MFYERSLRQQLAVRQAEDLLGFAARVEAMLVKEHQEQIAVLN